MHTIKCAMSQQLTPMPPQPSQDLQQLVRSEVDRATTLQLLERQIEEGEAAFVRMGQALRRIRDEKLYDQPSFKAYCEERWKWGREHAYFLMQAAQNYAIVAESKTVDVLPMQGRQMRAIHAAPDEQKPAVWDRAVEIAGGEQPTSMQVTQAVEEFKPESQRSNVVQMRPAKPPKPLENTEILGTELSIAQSRVAYLEEAIAALLAEFEASGTLSDQTVERLTNDIAGIPAA